MVCEQHGVDDYLAEECPWCRIRDLGAALEDALNLVTVWSEGPLFKNAGVRWPEGGCQAPALIKGRELLGRTAPDTPAEPLDPRSLFTAFDIHTDERIGQVFVNDHIEAIAMMLRMGAAEGSFYVKPSSEREPKTKQ